MEVVASLSQGRTAVALCGLFIRKSVPVIFEPPCICNCKTETFLADLIEYCNIVESSNDMKARTGRSRNLHVHLQDYACISLVK